METKVCIKCGEEKQLTEYYKRSKDSTLLRNECKECVKKRVSQHFNNKTEEEKKEIRLKNKKRQRELYYSDPEWRERNNKRGRIYYRDNAEKVFNRKKNYYNKSIPPGVYVIKNIVTDEILYVGESSVPRHRWDRHKSIQENATSPISKLITSGELNKDHIDFSIIEEIKDGKERIEREKYWIKKLNPSLNTKKK